MNRIASLKPSKHDSFRNVSGNVSFMADTKGHDALPKLQKGGNAETDEEPAAVSCRRK
jgi:hypothetical protein